MSATAAKVNTYTQVDVETASQGKLIVMLFNGAIKRAEEAKRQLAAGNLEGVHNNLVRAQDIVAELRGALNMRAGEIAQNLDRIYEYFHHLLVRANLKKSPEPIDEVVPMLAAMRDAWQELFDTVQREQRAAAAPRVNQHGNVVLNLQG